MNNCGFDGRIFYFFNYAARCGKRTAPESEPNPTAQTGPGNRRGMPPGTQLLSGSRPRKFGAEGGKALRKRTEPAKTGGRYIRRTVAKENKTFIGIINYFFVFLHQLGK